MVLGIEVPPERNWVALEQDDAEVRETEHGAAEHDSLDDPDMPLVDGNT